MNSKKLSRNAIILGSLCFLTALTSCARFKPFHPVEPEDIISTKPKQVITTPDRPGAWYSDRFIETVFGDCID